MTAIYIFLTLLFITTGIQEEAIDYQPCSIEVIRELKKETTEKSILRFISTYTKDCENDAEFAPAANWHLFYILQKFPSLTIRTLQKAEKELNHDLDYIIENYKHPINDDIDVSKLYEIIGKLPSSDMRDRIAENLKFQLSH